MSTNPAANLDDAIAELTATEADENAAAGALIDAYATVPAQIQAAVDAAQAKGATPAQLAAFGSLNNQLKSNADRMRAALAAPPAEEPTA